MQTLAFLIVLPNYCETWLLLAISSGLRAQPPLFDDDWLASELFSSDSGFSTSGYSAVSIGGNSLPPKALLSNGLVSLNLSPLYKELEKGRYRLTYGHDTGR